MPNMTWPFATTARPQLGGSEDIRRSRHPEPLEYSEPRFFDVMRTGEPPKFRGKIWELSGWHDFIILISSTPVRLEAVTLAQGAAVGCWRLCRMLMHTCIGT